MEGHPKSKSKKRYWELHPCPGARDMCPETKERGQGIRLPADSGAGREWVHVKVTVEQRGHAWPWSGRRPGEASGAPGRGRG